MEVTGTPDNYNQNQPRNTPGAIPPKTYLVESILVTLFCCLPFGIVGIVNSSKVESMFYAGNVQEAQRLSNEAKKWMRIGFWSGLIVGVLYGIFMLIMSLIGASAGNWYY